MTFDPLKDIWWMEWDPTYRKAVLLLGEIRSGSPWIRSGSPSYPEYIKGYHIGEANNLIEDGYPVKNMIKNRKTFKKASPNTIFNDVLRSDITNDPRLIAYYREALRFLAKSI